VNHCAAEAGRLWAGGSEAGKHAGKVIAREAGHTITSVAVLASGHVLKP